MTDPLKNIKIKNGNEAVIALIVSLFSKIGFKCVESKDNALLPESWNSNSDHVVSLKLSCTENENASSSWNLKILPMDDVLLITAKRPESKVIAQLQIDPAEFLKVSDNVVGSTEPAKRYRNQHLLQDELNEKIVQKLQLSNNDNKGDNNATASLRTDNERLQSLLAEPHRGPQMRTPHSSSSNSNTPHGATPAYGYGDADLQPAFGAPPSLAPSRHPAPRFDHGGGMSFGPERFRAPPQRLPPGYDLLCSQQILIVFF
mmetsp:Transcript_3506/g.5717  ORF Transcript_3506/g.5717 Transcript_3506/m.5717 type:complete len:259 (-) Transcript_3506:883-1659(-)